MTAGTATVSQKLSSTGHEIVGAVNVAHVMYYESNLWNAEFLGVPIGKNPMDLWAYQQLIAFHRPAIIIETGTNRGGSALYLAWLCEAIGHGRVITIDCTPHSYRPPHPRLTYLIGDSVAPKTLKYVDAWADGDQGMVILDSDHSAPHVARELSAYARFVPRGQHLIVEDGNINGHPALRGWGPGPTEAISAWLPLHPEFAIDRTVEPFLSFNPGGYLKRLAEIEE